jgi:ribonuclease Z
MDLSVFLAGTGGSVPSSRRGLPAIVIQRGGEKLLFDCGEGTQRQLMRSIGLPDLDAVFITHFHADHWLGLPGMLKSFALRDRDKPLTIYGPPGLRALMDTMLGVIGRRFPYGLNMIELERWEEVERGDYRIASVPVSHGERPAYGYVLLEEDRPGEFDPVAAQQLGVAPGRDFGILQRGEMVGDVRPEQVTGPARKGRKIVISGDTTPAQALVVAAHEADVLIHEATFLSEESARAAETSHSTARQAAEVARDAEVHLLVLTHISGRYHGGELRDEARAVFAATEAPRDFDTIEVPFPERGEATFVRWSDRRTREQPPTESDDVPSEVVAAP